MASTTTKTDAHIRKRPFQPSITSYFNQSSRDGSISYTSKSTSPLSPPLPVETQASLLSVGMRVRKSVPEGYKTHKTLGSAGFPFPSTAPGVLQSHEGQQRHAISQKELMPFCGLHKTGGWAAQELPASSAPAVLTHGGDFDEDEMGVPGLSWSQDTLSSTQNSFVGTNVSPMSSRKRTYEVETEDELDAFFDDVNAEEVVEQQILTYSRPIARMKGSAVKARPSGSIKVFGEDDFEEATFLSPMEVDEI